MGFLPISISGYIKKYLKNNTGENEKDLRKRLNSTLSDYRKGVKCSCGNDIWVVGSASVGNKNNFNQKKIDRHLEYIENKLKEYNQALAESDGDNKKQVEKEIDKQNNRKDDYKKIEKQLKETGQAQVSTSDPDSQQMIVRNNITEIAYNAQTTVDDKHNLLIDYKVTNNNDSKAMGAMLRRAKNYTTLQHLYSPVR